eukprot:scaffold10131_cov61-Phaeocystis_antarctica.AAC.2
MPLDLSQSDLQARRGRNRTHIQSYAPSGLGLGFSSVLRTLGVRARGSAPSYAPSGLGLGFSYVLRGLGDRSSLKPLLVPSK